MIQREKTVDRTLGHVWADLKQAGPWIASGILIGTLAAFVFVYLATPFFRAQMIIAPANPMDAPAVSTVFDDSNPLMLRAMAQNAMSAGSPDFLRFESLYSGLSVASELLKDEKIIKALSFDYSFAFLKKDETWTAEGLSEYIAQRVKLEPVGAMPLRRMVYLHPSRDFAVYFLHRLHKVTDDMIRVQTRGEAQERVDYLTQESAKTKNPDHRRLLTALLMQEERILMLTSIDQPYSTSLIEPPAGSSRAKWPAVAVIFPVFIFVGALFGFILYGLNTPSTSYRYRHVSQRQSWFKAQGDNNNDMPLFKRDAAE